jgi:hypothetical protein
LLGLQCLRTAPVARVAAAAAFDGVLVVAEMVGELGLQSSLDERTGELLEKSLWTGEILRLRVAGEQLVQQSPDGSSCPSSSASFPSQERPSDARVIGWLHGFSDRLLTGSVNARR